MALVFKIKFRDTLRRWVVSSTRNEAVVLPAVNQIDAKIRELFLISPAVCIVITYMDKDDDVVTLADDRDLLDACLEQRLNPLRLEVKIREESSNDSTVPSTVSDGFTEDGAVNDALTVVRSPARADSRKHGLLQNIKPAAVLWPNVHKALSKFLKALARENGWEMYDGYQTSPPSTDNPNVNISTHHPHPGHTDKWDSSPHRNRNGIGEWNRIFHSGVKCDGCGMSPIEGCRFISKRNPNYDLCSICFDLIGNERDYHKIEHPLHPPPHSFHNIPHARERRPRIAPKPRRPVFAHDPHSWQSQSPTGMRPGNFFPSSEVDSKLDARFVKDITIIDGTELAPLTNFTKIWRLSNNGTAAWPQKTQLVHIGGDILVSEGVVDLKIPEGGLSCGDHIDASVDLIAPERAGRYVSHWCLLSPFGMRFGHRLWVVIQVVPTLLQESVKGKGIFQEENNAVGIISEIMQVTDSDNLKLRDALLQESVKGKGVFQEENTAVGTTSETMQIMNSDNLKLRDALLQEGVKGKGVFQEENTAVGTTSETMQGMNSDNLNLGDVVKRLDGAIRECHDGQDEQICNPEKDTDGSGIKVVKQDGTRDYSTFETDAEDSLAKGKKQCKQNGPTEMTSVLAKPGDVVVDEKEHGPTEMSSVIAEPEDVLVDEMEQCKQHGPTEMSSVIAEPEDILVDEEQCKQNGPTEMSNVTAEAEDVLVDAKEQCKQNGPSEMSNEIADAEDVLVDEQEQCLQHGPTEMSSVIAEAEDVLVGEQEQHKQYEPTEMSSEVDGFSIMEKPNEITEWDLLNVEASERKDNSTHCEHTVLQDTSINILSDQEMQLQLLESMGYTDRTLNAELLKKNNQNLELTVDDLIMASGWDNILAELQDMGFDDKSTNCQLLIENKGSIKWVVKHLMQIEKDRVGQTGKDTVNVA